MIGWRRRLGARRALRRFCFGAGVSAALRGFCAPDARLSATKGGRLPLVPLILCPFFALPVSRQNTRPDNRCGVPKGAIPTNELFAR